MAIDLKAIQAKLASRPKGKDSDDIDNSKIKWIKPPREGQIKVIFLPPLHGAAIPGILQYTHWGIPEINRLTCLRTFEKTCPICEKLKELQVKVADDLLKEYRSQGRAVHNVVVIEDSSIPENEPYVFTSPEYTYWWLMQSILDPDLGDITNPEHSHPAIFKRVSAGGRFERTISIRERPLADSPAKIKEILDKAADLSKIWKYSDELYEKLTIASNTIAEKLLEKSASIGGSAAVPTPTLATPSPSEDLPFGGETPQPAPVQASPAPTASAGADKPKDAPECWGNHVDGSDKCGLCAYELGCEKSKG